MAVGEEFLPLAANFFYGGRARPTRSLHPGLLPSVPGPIERHNRQIRPPNRPLAAPCEAWKTGKNIGVGPAT